MIQGQEENNYSAPTTAVDPDTVTVTTIPSDQIRDAEEDQNFDDDDSEPTDDHVSVNVSPILGTLETILRTVYMVSCIGVLISAAIALPAIDQVENFYEKHHLESVKHGFDYKDADSYRGAAGWLVFASAAAIPYNILMIIFRILYLKSILKPYFIIFALINGVSSVLFVLSLSVGGILSVVFASDNGNLWLDLCSDYNVRDRELDFCDDLQRVANTESAAGALSFLATVVLVVLILLMVYSGAKAREVNRLDDYSPLPQSAELPTIAAPLVEVNISQTQNVTMSAPSPSQPSANTSEDHVIPSALLYPLADVSSYSSPTAPLCPSANLQSSYGSTEPPPYESAVAMPQHVPSAGNPPNDSKTGTVW